MKGVPNADARWRKSADTCIGVRKKKRWAQARTLPFALMFANHPTLHDVVRFARNVEVTTEKGRKKFQPLIGEERGFLTVFTSFLMARRMTLVDSHSGTGKTVMTDAVVQLAPSEVETVDMLSAKAIHAKANDLNKKRFLYAPELQNAGDIDDVVKAMKKHGEGKSAKREVTGGLLENGQRALVSTELEWHPWLTTRAVENKVADAILNEEAMRRFVIVATDPSAAQTRNVLRAQARVAARGVAASRDMSDAEIMALQLHVAGAINAYEQIDSVLIPGAEAFVESVPDVFTTSRSAFPTLLHVAKGVGVFYHDDEYVDDKTLVLSPGRFAELIEFYGPTFYANCLKIPAMGRAVLDAMPSAKPDRNGVIAPTAMLTLAHIVDALAVKGYSVEKKKVESTVKKLHDDGYLALNEELEGKRYHLTALADVQTHIDWPAILDDARCVARETLGDQADEWVKRYCAGSSVTYKSPITGEMTQTGVK